MLTFITLSSCQKLTQIFESNDYQSKIDVKTGSDHLSIIFSHNINGETHPCGCRQFPLGGLSQVYGAIEKQKQIETTIMVDSGDIFFPSSNVPQTMKKSLKFVAEEIAASLDLLNYSFIVLGDQDFALGEDFLAQLANRHRFKFLITNKAAQNKIKSIPYAQIKLLEKSIFFLGVTDPDVLPKTYQKLFSDPIESIDHTLKQLNTEIKEHDEVILLSHSGIETDKMIAQKFSRINWIIGAHSMSFLREPIIENDTKIVQVLSRNHYLGHIQLPLARKLKNYQYQLIETRDELKDVVSNNPMISRLVKHKEKLKEIQKNEQLAMSNQQNDDLAPTFQSCFQCHNTQAQFWQTTSHSLAYITLLQNNEHLNSQCIECHSVKYRQQDGFQATTNIVFDKNKKAINQDIYLTELGKIFGQTDQSAIKKLKPSQIKKLSEKWIEMDKKLDVGHNFSNVQCLNCHDKKNDHPFAIEETSTKDYLAKCIQCHNNDQSAHWYVKDEKGLPTQKLDSAIFEQNLKKVSCPKGGAEL